VVVGKSWSDKILGSADREAISAKIAEVEHKTSGEIIPMVVYGSIRPGQLPLVIGLSLFSIFLLMDWHFWLSQMILSTFVVAPGAFVVCYVVGHVLSRSLKVQRLLTPKSEQWAEVQERAVMEFYQSQFDHTKRKTGILLFVSYAEHKVVVLADKGISSKVPDSTWNEVVNILTSHIKQGQWRDGFLKAIDECGRHLIAHFPPAATNTDEIPNNIIIKE